MKTVYLFTADGVEEVEALTVVDLLRRAEVNVSMVSISGSRQITGAHGIVFMADLLFDELAQEADMLVLPGGGPGTQNLMHHEGLKKMLLHYNHQKKDLAAICAAPGVLGIHGILNGKRAVCYPGCEENLVGATVLESTVVIDENIITSKGPGTAMEFALVLIQRLCGEEKMQEIKQGLLYVN